MRNDLARSGFNELDIKQLKVKPHSPHEVNKLTNGKYNAIAYSIPYFTLGGKLSGFQRLRILDTKGAFGSELKKYYQLTNTLPQLYFSPFLDWESVLGDTDFEIIITEGEKKAAKACSMGLITIGLGGVWSWRSKKHKLKHLTEFDNFNWKDRKVSIVFDNDLKTNMNVMQAMYALATELLSLGAKPCFIWLPESDDKIGLDDYFLTNSLEDFYALEEEEFLDSIELWKLNDELAYINASSGVYIFKDSMMVNKQLLIGMVYANRTYIKKNPVNDDITIVNAASEWLKWSSRREHKKLTYSPGRDLICGDNEYNVWKKWGATPVKGNIKPWDKLLDYIFKDVPEKRIWFEQWCAYPIQNPGIKMYTSTLLISLHTGTGKSVIGMTLGRIYGDNYALLTEEELHSSFNSWSKNKQFILADEITGSDRRRDSDRIKQLITRESVHINEKFQPAYQLPDCINYLFTSNHPDAMFLEVFDRRFFVHEIRSSPLPDSFYKEYDDWYRSDSGINSLFHYLKHDINCKNFNPKQRAPESEDRSDMISLSASDLDLWCRSLKNHPDSILRKAGKELKRDLWTLDELIILIDPENQKKITGIALSKALRRVNIRQKQVRTTEGVKRLWVVRNEEKWFSANHKTVVDHYEGADKTFRLITGGKAKKY